MPDKNRFAELLEKYLSGNITPEEHQEFTLLIKSGVHDHFLQQYIDHSLRDENITADLENNRAQALLHSILNAEKHTAKLIPATRRPQKYWLIGIAAVITGMVIMAWWLWPAKKVSIATPDQKESLSLQPARDSKGKKYIRLQDGSTVLLNEGSRLEYPDTFGAGSREVTLTGEGYFDIKHDSARPFIVHTGKVSTTVLGTAFNVRAYPDQKAVTVTVTRGKVKVSGSTKTFGVITPNESIAVNTENGTWIQETVNAEQVVEWKKEYLVLDNISLGEAAILIGSRYHVNISFSNEQLRQCSISATFLNNESIEQVLTVVTGVMNATYTMQPNDQVIIRGKGCDE
jgi:transmembrane sensor